MGKSKIVIDSLISTIAMLKDTLEVERGMRQNALRKADSFAKALTAEQNVVKQLKEEVLANTTKFIKLVAEREILKDELAKAKNVDTNKDVSEKHYPVGTKDGEWCNRGDCTGMIEKFYLDNKIVSQGLHCNACEWPNHKPFSHLPKQGRCKNVQATN